MIIRQWEFRVFAEKGKDSLFCFSFLGCHVVATCLLSFSHLWEKAEYGLLNFLFERMLLVFNLHLHNLSLCFLSPVLPGSECHPKLQSVGFFCSTFKKNVTHFNLLFFLTAKSYHVSLVGTEDPKMTNMCSGKLADVTFRWWSGEWILMLIAHPTSLGLLKCLAWPGRS